MVVSGKVKWFQGKLGYGFVTDNAGQDYFVHHTNIMMDGYRNLHEGDLVEFEIVDSQKGKQAVKVTLIKKAEKRSGKGRS